MNGPMCVCGHPLSEHEEVWDDDGGNDPDEPVYTFCWHEDCKCEEFYEDVS